VSKSRVIYKADLQRVGSLLNESLKVLTEYAKLKDWKKTKEIILSKNLLNKRSTQTLQGILAAIRKRFLSEYDFLPNPHLLARVVSEALPRSVKIQILYPYICESDPLIKALILNVVAKKMETVPSSTLTKLDILEFLESEQEKHPELKKWSDYLKKRWTRGFLAFLRDLNMMEKAPSYKLLKPLLRTEAFTFFMMGLLDRKLSPIEALRNDLWKLYFLKDFEIEQLLIDAQARGWFYFFKAGDIIELKPRYPSLERWLDECLG